MWSNLFKQTTRRLQNFLPMKNKTSYLIYYAEQDQYEGRDIPFAIVNSKKRAEKITKEIIDHGKLIAAQMKNPFEEDISDEEYSLRWDKNRELQAGVFPYNWRCRSFDFERDSSSDTASGMKFDESTVAFKELPVI